MRCGVTRDIVVPGGVGGVTCDMVVPGGVGGVTHDMASMTLPARQRGCELHGVEGHRSSLPRQPGGLPT